MGSNCCKGDAAGKPLVRSSSSIYNRSRAGAKLEDRFKRSDDAGGVRLTISAARTGDSGVYTLQASNAAGKDSTRVRLEVSPDETPTGEDPPTFLRRLQDLTVKVGTRTRFLVEIVSSTECRVTWYRNERRLLEAERIALVRDGNFWCADISAVSVDDAGRWTCTAENVGGRASCSAHLNVLVPKAYKRPEFVEELRALLTEQGTVSLECKVVGVPTPVLRWFKDSREIKAGDVFALTANAEDPTSLGTYTCEAVNCMGRAYSSSKVHVVGRSSKENSSRPSSGGITPEPPPIFTKELEDQFVRICEPLTLSCHIVVPPWPRSVVWYNKEGKIEPSERYHVLEDGVGGYLLEVPSAEWPDEGEWKCVATSSGGRVGISTCYVSMDVPKNYRKPRFMENLQAVLTEEGLVSFECKVVGFPTPLLSWFKDGQELKPGDVYQLTGTNSLGSYCCIARNCMGQASSSAELTVEDIQNQLNEEEKLQLFSRNQAPKFLQGLKSIEAKIDEPFRFTIKVAIPPEPTILWYRDDQPIDESSRCHHGKEERGVFHLDIQNLEFMDQAEWKCVAMNDYGHSVTSCFLKLIIPRHFKKPRFLENLQAILSDEGAVNLECKVIGVPQPVLKWYKDGEELKPGDIHRIISGQDGTCCLGTYTCEAQNCMGIAASSASLLGFEDSMKAKTKKKADEQALQRNLSLSTIHEERTSQMYDTPIGDMTLDEKGEISFSFDGKEVSVSLYETPDLTEEEALQIIEMYADQLSENVTEHNVVELPPLRFVKETSTSGNLLMEAIIIDVSPEYFTSPEEDLRTEADIEDISIAEDNGAPQISLDVEADGEDYLEKTIALLSDEKSDILKKTYRKKSDSQRSADDYFSLSRDQSLSDEKKEDDTQILSESDLQSFASARSSGKPKSKSSKPSIEDGQESSDITKTVVLREDLQNQMIETDVSAVKHKKTRRRSRSSRRSSSGSEKSFSKMKEDMADMKTECAVNVGKIDFNKEKVKTAMNRISLSLTEVINEIQILERDIILKSEFMATAATASNSLEMINTLITPLSEIHCITDATREAVEYSENITSLLNNLPESLQNLQRSLTIINKCIDVERENKTLVTKTCISIIKKCGQQLHNIIKDINATVTNECPFVEKIHKSNIDTMTTDLVSIISNSLDMVDIEENKKSDKGENVKEITLEFKHLHDTQKAIHDLRGSLRSLLFIVEEVDISKANSFPNIKTSEIILNDMSTPIQDLQTALEQIETLSIAESKSDLHKYNTEMIETAMESVLKLRTSFEQLSAEASIMEDKDALNEVLNAIKCNIKAISIQLDELEAQTGKFDILNNDNKLEALQKMAQILINLENNLPMLETVSSVKYYMTEFHKSLTKVLENVIESNDANKYFNLLEICDAVNRMNASLKSIDSNSELSLASIINTLKIIQRNLSINVFQPELNSTLTSSIANTLLCIQETINKADELSLNDNLDNIKDLSISKYEDRKVNVMIENIEKTIATISNVISHETVKDMTLKIAIENVYPILVDLKYCIASLNVTFSGKNENLSDIESVSFSQSVANSLIELHQTINVLNQVICENADSEDFSQLSTDYAKTLLDLCHTLETLQHDVVSQCIDNETNFDISSSIANIVKNLKSCIHLIIQEQPIIEVTDDMSTLDDISGIKTTADVLSGDEFMIATIKESDNILFAERQLLLAPGNVLQTLKDYIVILQNSDVLNVLKPVEYLEYTSLKSLIIRLDEICPQIESILHPITMESNQEQICFANFDKLLEVIPLLQDMQQCLTNIDVNTIQVKNDPAETNSEKFNFVQENFQNFKSHLNYCIDIILPAVEVVDNTVDVSTKVVSLRQSCQKLHSSLLELEKPIEQDKEINTDISRLKKTTELFLKTRMQQNTAHIKWAIENLYEAVVSLEIALTQIANNRPELLSKDNIFIQFVHDVKKDIVALQQCNFVILSNLNVLEKDVVVEKSKVYKDSTNKADNLILHLKELVTPLEIIHNQLMDEKKNINLELLQETFYEKIDKVDLELVKGQLNNINETVKKFEQYLSFDDISVNGDDIDMVTKLNNTVNDILGSIEYMKLTESIKTISQPIEIIKNILDRILFAEKVDGKQTLLKEKTEKLLQHMDHYIEIIDIVEEVSAVIKLEDLKETANIVRELQQSLINTNLTSEDSIRKASDGKILEEQAEIAQRLHKALVSVQIQALESSRKLVSSADEDIRQQIIQLVSDLQNDLMALASTNVITEEILTTTAFESNIEEQNANLVLENKDEFKEIAKEEILLETIQLTKHNEVDSESKLSQSTYSNTNVQLDSSSQLSEVEKETFSAGLILEELKSIEDNHSKPEKLATINEILVENLNEYISENTVAVMSKLSHTLQSENFNKTVEIAKQLWHTILSETATSGKIDLTQSSTKQVKLILSLNEAIVITYQTTIEESQELENKVGREKLQSFKNVVTNLRSTLQEIINNIKSLPSVSESDDFNERHEETNIAKFVEQIPTEDPSNAESYLIETIKDLNCNIANNNLPKEVTKSLETNQNLLNSEGNNCYKDKKAAIDTKELYEENKDLTIVSSTIDQNILKFDTEIDINKRFITKENLINHIGEYFCEQTVNDLLSLFKVEDIQPSIEIAHQLYDSFSAIESEISNISTKQLKLAVILEKTVTSLLESTGRETEDIKALAGKKELLKTNIVLSNLRNDLKTLIETTLIDTNISILDLDDLKVHITREPFKYEIICSNILGTISANETISENINDREELELPISHATEIIDDSNDATKTEITSEEIHDQNSMKEKNRTDELKEKLQIDYFGDDNSIIKLENLLKEVNDMIDISCNENLEAMQNSFDEVQTIIMKMKSDIDGNIGDAINETLEDLECNVRSVQLQIIENSPQALLKEACTNLQMLVAHVSEINEFKEIVRPTTNKVANDELNECSNDAMQTIEIIEKVSCFKNTQHLEHIISSLNQIKDSIKSLRLKFLTNADTLIMEGIEIVQSIDQVEEKIFCLEKDLESAKDVDPITRDHIISAVHCVYGSISNMRGTISSVQKKYMYENYGKPSRYFLTSIKNVRELVKNEKTSTHWKQFSQSLRKVLNHFEDIKFYINFDKTARLPGDAAFTKVILGELVSVLSREVLESVCNLDTEVIENVHDCVKHINRKLSDIEPYTTIEVKEKIPIFKDLSIIILELTKVIIECIQNEMMIKKDEDKTGSDLIPSQTAPYKEDVNGGEDDKNTIINEVVNVEFKQTLPEIIIKNEETSNGEDVITKQSVPQGMLTVDEIMSTTLKEEIKNASIQQHQVESKFLQSDENQKMLANMNLENKCIIQTEGIPLEEDSCSKSYMKTEENYTDSTNIKEKTKIDSPETINEIEVSEVNQEKVCDSEYLLHKNTKEQLNDDQSLPEFVSIDNNDELGKKVDIKIQQQEKKQIENSKVCDKNEKYVNADDEKNKELSETKEVEENVYKKQEKQHKKDTVLSIERKVEELVDPSIENENTQESKPIELRDMYEKNEEGGIIVNVEEKKEFIKSLEIKENIEITTGIEEHFNKEYEKQEQECKETLSPIESTAEKSLESSGMPGEEYKPQKLEQPKESKNCDENEKVIVAQGKEKKESLKVMETKENEESTGNKVRPKQEYEVQENQQRQTISTIESTVAESVQPFMENTDMLVKKSKLQAITQVEEVTMCVSHSDEKRVTKEDEEKKEEMEIKVYYESSPSQSNVKTFEFQECQEQEHQQKVTLFAEESTVKELINTCVENIDMPTNKSNLRGTIQIEESEIYADSEGQFTNNGEEKKESLKGTEIKEDKAQIETENKCRVTESVNSSDKNIDILKEKSIPQKIEQVEDIKICNDSVKEIIANIEDKEDSIKVSEIKEHEKSSTREGVQFENEFEKQEQKYEETVSNIDSTLEEAVTTSKTNTVLPAEKCEPQETMQIKDSEICNSSVSKVNVNVEEKEKSTEVFETKEYEESSTDKYDKFKKEFKDHEQKETVSNIKTTLEESEKTSLNNKDVGIFNISKHQEKEQVKESKVCDNSEKQIIVNIEEKEKSTTEFGTKEYKECNIGNNDQLKKEFKDKEQQEKETVSTIESMPKESVDTVLENKDMLVDKSTPHEIEQIKENKICDNSKKQVIVSLDKNEKSINVMETKEYEESTVGKEDQVKDQEQQQKETILTSESMVAESVNIFAQSKDVPLDNSVTENDNKNFKEEVMDNLVSFDDITNKMYAELEVKENKSDFSNDEIINDLIKEIKTEITTHEVANEEKSSCSPEHYSENLTGSIKLEIATETLLDEILTKCDTLDLQIQQEEKHYDKVIIKPKPETKISGKEDDADNFGVNTTVSYNNESIKESVAQKEVTETDIDELINEITKVDLFDTKQEDMLLIQDVESKNTNEHITQQGHIDILDSNQLIQKEINQDAYKEEDDKHLIMNKNISVHKPLKFEGNNNICSDETLILEANNNDLLLLSGQNTKTDSYDIKKNTEKTLKTQIDNKISIEHIDNGQTRKQKNNEKEIEKEVEAKIEEDKLIIEETQYSKTENLIEEKHVGHSDIEEKLKENIGKIVIQTITELGGIEKEISVLNNPIKKEENAEIKIERDSFSDVLSDFSVTETISKIAYKSQDDLKGSKNNLEESCGEKIETEKDKETKCLEFKDNIGQLVAKSSNTKEYSETNFENKTENVKNVENNLDNIVNDFNKTSISTTQNIKVLGNQDSKKQLIVATAEKEGENIDNINIDKKQKTLITNNEDSEGEVNRCREVGNSHISKEEVSQILQRQEKNIEEIENLKHPEVANDTHLLEKVQEVEKDLSNEKNREQLQTIIQENPNKKEESKEQIQEEKKNPENKMQKQSRRSKKLLDSSKPEVQNEKLEKKPQETNEKNMLVQDKNIEMINFTDPNIGPYCTKPDDANVLFNKDDKQNQDNHKNIEQKEQTTTVLQKNKLEIKETKPKFLYEKEAERDGNINVTNDLARQLNEKESVETSKNKKEILLIKKKESDKINPEEKEIEDEKVEELKDYDISEQLKNKTSPILKDIRKGQMANEQTEKITNTIIADNTLTDFESEFSRPPGYLPKAYCVDDTMSQIQITNNKAQTIYKVQTLRHDLQLRYSIPPPIVQASDIIEGRSQIKEKTKAASECRSTLSEKRSSSSRDVKRKPVFSTFLTDRTAVESSRVKLTCTVLTSTEPKVTWYKNGVQLENKHKFRSKFVDGLITLEILNALPSDSGEYSCCVENKNGSIMSSANLKVYPSFEASPIPPTFTRSIRDTYHLAENELILECRIRGQPLPTITWLKNDKPVLSERYQAHYLADGVCRLTISNPTTEDSGKYTCKAESSVWSDKITHDVFFTGKKGRSSPNIVTVEKLNFNRLGLESRRPHFTNVLSDHKVVTGGTIGLQVEIRGSPTRVEWLREGHSVTELYRNAQTYVDRDIYTLALPDVTEKESGLYTCRAYSNQGNVDMNASITVVQPNQYEGKPATIVSRPEKDVIISVGEDLNISFRVHGDPKAKVFFMKGIRDLTNSQRVCKMTSDDYVKFTLKRTVVSDAGTYCIYVRNAYGCDRAFVTVVIRQRASSENLISDWTYPMDDLAISSLDRNYKSVPDRIPSEPSVVHGGNNWVSLAWPKSDHQSRAPILAYKVESWLLGKEGGARWIELGITPRNSFDVFNLKHGEEYHFRVTPRNRYGWGESVQTSVPIGIGLAGDRPEFVEILPGQLKVLVGEKAILHCSFTGKPIPEIVWMKNGHEIEEEPGRVIIEMNNFHTSLRIEEIKIDDEGRYSCEATNVHGRSSTYARMAVITDRQIWEADAKLKRERSAGIDGEYPPQFTMRLRDRRVQATYPVRLTCQVVGNPPPLVKWFKNEEEVTIEGRYTASQDECFYTLEIAPTTLEDGGVYEAMARNSCGAVSCRCNLVVDKGIRAYIAPEFCCGLEPLYRLSEGEELRISAIVEAYPSVGVTWYRDGVRLRPSRRAIMTLDRDGQIELALASVTGRDAGVYTCTASNEVGMASTSGKVEVVSGEYVIEKTPAPPILICSDMPYSKEPMFIRKPRSSEAREGDTVIIECEVTGDPKPDVYWLRDFLKPDYYRDSSHFKRIDAGPAYRFEIPHAKLDYTGAYSIVAKNIHGETKAIISLQILAKDLSCGDDVHNIKYGRVEVIPRFDKDLTDLLCYDGDAVEFECSVTGNPDPEIRWLHYNENVPECSYFEKTYDEGIARLKIKQVTAEDEGTYTCETSNCLGKASSSACLVVYPPGEPNTLSTRLRRPPALLSAASTPRSTPRTTPARSMSRTPGPEPRRLCSPSREIAPKFYTYPFNRVAEEGDTVVFQCAVKGLPPPWATWDKDGIIITPSARITIKEKDEMFRILEIEQVTIEDVGLYRISLENDYGRAEASARLEVITQKGKFYGSTRSYSVSPRKTLPYRRRTPSFSKQD